MYGYKNFLLKLALPNNGVLSNAFSIVAMSTTRNDFRVSFATLIVVIDK